MKFSLSACPIILSGCSEEPTLTADIVKGEQSGCTVKGKPELSENGERVLIKLTSIECPLVENE